MSKEGLKQCRASGLRQTQAHVVGSRWLCLFRHEPSTCRRHVSGLLLGVSLPGGIELVKVKLRSRTRWTLWEVAEGDWFWWERTRSVYLFAISALLANVGTSLLIQHRHRVSGLRISHTRAVLFLPLLLHKCTGFVTCEIEPCYIMYMSSAGRVFARRHVELQPRYGHRHVSQQ